MLVMLILISEACHYGRGTRHRKVVIIQPPEIPRDTKSFSAELEEAQLAFRGRAGEARRKKSREKKQRGIARQLNPTLPPLQQVVAAPLRPGYGEIVYRLYWTHDVEERRHVETEKKVAGAM